MAPARAPRPAGRAQLAGPSWPGAELRAHGPSSELRAQLAVNRAQLAGGRVCVCDPVCDEGSQTPSAQLAGGRGPLTAPSWPRTLARGPGAARPGPGTGGRVPAAVYAVSQRSEHPPRFLGPPVRLANAKARFCTNSYQLKCFRVWFHVKPPPLFAKSFAIKIFAKSKTYDLTKSARHRRGTREA